jgi:TolB protein
MKNKSEKIMHVRYGLLQPLVASLIALSCSSQQSTYQESGIANLTQITSDKSVEFDPSFSKDGSKIYFSSDRGGNLELWMLPVSGGGIQQLTNSSNFSADRSPHPSPSEEEVVFQSTRVTGRWNIWKISLGNRGLTQLTNNPYGSFGPKFSPDGTRIAYVAYDKTNTPYIWVMGSSGENPTQLGPGLWPDWSPKGEVLVYCKSTRSDNYDIWFMSPDGTSPQQLTREPEKQELFPAWSADGKRIAYVVQYDLDEYFRVDPEGRLSDQRVVRSEVWVMDQLGRNATQLTAFLGLNTLPSWSKDGKIAFISNRGDSWDIWSMVPLKK